MLDGSNRRENICNPSNTSYLEKRRSPYRPSIQHLILERLPERSRIFPERQIYLPIIMTKRIAIQRILAMASWMIGVMKNYLQNPLLLHILLIPPQRVWMQCWTSYSQLLPNPMKFKVNVSLWIYWILHLPPPQDSMKQLANRKCRREIQLIRLGCCVNPLLIKDIPIPIQSHTLIPMQLPTDMDMELNMELEWGL